MWVCVQVSRRRDRSIGGAKKKVAESTPMSRLLFANGVPLHGAITEQCRFLHDRQDVLEWQQLNYCTVFWTLLFDTHIWRTYYERKRQSH